MKNKIAKLLFVVLCIVLLGGCGNKNSSGSNKKGEKVCFESECFYVVNYDSEKKIKTLIAVNILNKNNRQYVEGDSISTKLSILFYDKKKYEYAYWVDKVNDYGLAKLKQSYGDKFPVYVYDSNSLAYGYLEEYKKYLNEELNANVSGIRLPSLEDMSLLGCSEKIESGAKECEEAEEWVYLESYWLGTSYDPMTVYYIGRVDGGYIGKDAVTGVAAHTNYVRPIIEISVK